MASKKTLNAKNLEALGAGRLAELLIEISTGDGAAKRRLRLELAGAAGPAEVAREVRKRLATVGRSRTFVDWRKRKALVDDLQNQRAAIVEKVAPRDPGEALDLMWRFLAIADSVLERCDDSSGLVYEIFRFACEDLGEIAKAGKPDPATLADRAFNVLMENRYGLYNRLIAVLSPALGREGLEHLKRRVLALSKESLPKARKKVQLIAGWDLGNRDYRDEILESSRASTVRLALQAIADAQGDVDAFITQYDEKTRKVPRIAADIAQRLLAGGRAEDAWSTIEATEHGRRDWPDFEWEDARIDVLEAFGRSDEAQAARWSCFERSLSAPHLRAYLKQLPDFDDLEAEEQALDHARKYTRLLQALSFFVSWPDLDRAASLVIERAGELDGNHYEFLTPAAHALAGKHPLAATLVLRAMVDFSLTQGRSSRYRHAARHFMECASLASTIQDFGNFETHETYDAKLRGVHGRKSSFWSLVT